MTELQKKLDQILTRICTLDVREALALLGQPDVCFVDLRDGHEIDIYGKIPGSEHCPRGSLEFRIPSDSPYHRSFFTNDRRFVFYCSHGQRSILATDTARQLGLQNVCHIKGGMVAWVKAGGAVEKGGQ